MKKVQAKGGQAQLLSSGTSASIGQANAGSCKTHGQLTSESRLHAALQHCVSNVANAVSDDAFSMLFVSLCVLVCHCMLAQACTKET